MIQNPFNNLKMKWWFAILLTASFVVFVMSLSTKFIVFDNKTIAYLSAGVFFISLGEFAHQTFQEGIDPVLRFKITREFRGHSIAGYILEIIGIILILKGFKIF